ncbi:hypothetical protein [Piscicoccus intestinalis]|uniref:hypothetical protein n=1 Tax=Piscicoccus intestinalis TaxID=746033 RepID=UPI000838C268|nr:hypothetical protein [Piscicoccus intestinalis]
MITAAVYLGALRAHWRKLVALALIGLVLGVAASRMMPVSFMASRLLVVTAQGATGLSDLSQGGTLAASQAQALAYVGNSGSTVGEALRTLGADPALAAGATIAASVPPNTSYVEITATASEGQLATQLARAAAERLIRANEELTSPLADSAKAALLVRDVTPPSAQDESWSKGLPRWLLPAAGMLALPVLAYFVLVLRSAVKPTVGESLDLDDIVPFPILGTIPRERNRALEVVRPRPPHVTAIARAGLMEAAEGGRVVALTAVEGPSDCRTALGLGQSLAQLGRRVLVVDADLQRPTLGGAQSGGLAAALQNGRDPGTDLRPWLDSSLQVLPTSSHTAGTRLLLSPRARDVFAALRKKCDIVLVSTPAALSGPDAAALADLSDEVILLADTTTAVDHVIDAGLGFREGSIGGLLVLDRGLTPRWTARQGKAEQATGAA